MTQSPHQILPYAATPPSRTPHDTIYTAGLAAVTFFQMVSAGIFISIVLNGPTESRGVMFGMFTFLVSLFLFELSILILRIVSPSRRKWPTFALNLVLLVSFPFGTALAIYGLIKIDKTLPPPPA